jgi:hypothetical protein
VFVSSPIWPVARSATMMSLDVLLSTLVLNPLTLAAVAMATGSAADGEAASPAE